MNGGDLRSLAKHGLTININHLKILPKVAEDTAKNTSHISSDESDTILVAEVVCLD